MIAMQDGERVVAVVVGIQLFASLITQGNVIGIDHVLSVDDGLPVGATYLRGWIDERALNVWLLFWHSSFEPVAQGDHIPTLDIVIRKDPTPRFSPLGQGGEPEEARDAGA